MNKRTLIIIAVIAMLIVGYLFWNGNLDKTTQVKSGDRLNPSKCIPKKGLRNWDAWEEDNIPYGHLIRYAIRIYGDQGDDQNQQNSYVIGGFFKAIDVYPTDGAYSAYKSELTDYVKNDGATWGNALVGELKCL